MNPAGLLSDAPYPGYAGAGASDLRRGIEPGAAARAAAAMPGATGTALERDRMRDLRQAQLQARMQSQLQARPARPARQDRFARWHVPEANEQESEGWLLPYLDLITLLLALLVALLAYTQAVPAEPEPAPAPELVGSIGAAGLPDMDATPLAGMALPHIPAEWADLPDPPEPASSAPAPAVTTEPAGPGMTAAVSVPPDTSTAAVAPGPGGTGQLDAAAPPPMPDVPAAAPPPSLSDLGLDALGDSVDVIVSAQSINFRISNELLFPPAQADLGSQGREILDRLAGIINRTQFHVSVEGHSDAVPIQNERFPSNWELSTARATSVLRQLERDGVASDRLSATGYAHTRPIASNGSAAGRAANRRVELIMQTGGGAPAPTAAHAPGDSAGPQAVPAAQPSPPPQPASDPQ